MSQKKSISTRRRFLRQSAAAGGLLFVPGLIGCSSGNSPASAESDSPAPRRDNQDRKLGIAILGLGGYASGQIAPALEMTEYCELRGLVTCSPEMLPGWQS